MPPLLPQYPALSKFLAFFSFKDDASRAHALAALLGLALPPSEAAYLPEFLIQGPPASGKTLFTRSLHAFAFGDCSFPLHLPVKGHWALPPVIPAGVCGRGLISVLGGLEPISDHFVWELRNALAPASPDKEWPHMICCEQSVDFDHKLLERGLLIELEVGDHGAENPVDFMKEHRIDVALEIGWVKVAWGQAGKPRIDEDRIAKAGLPDQSAEFVGAMYHILKLAEVPGFLGNRALPVPLESA